MEYNIPKPRHRTSFTECKLHFTANDHNQGQGLLDIVDRTQVGRFKGTCYSVTTPIEDVVKLYRLHHTDPGVIETGQYWTHTPDSKHRRSNSLDISSRQSDEVDIPDGRVNKVDIQLAKSKSDDGHCVNTEDVLIVPKGILLYEGFSSETEQIHKDKTQIFIPKMVVTPLLRYQRELVCGHMTDVRRQFLLAKIDRIQTQQISEWTKKYIANVLSGKPFDIPYVLGENTDMACGQ